MIWTESEMEPGIGTSSAVGRKYRRGGGHSNVFSKFYEKTYIMGRPL
jgi:hypothetical protein